MALGLLLWAKSTNPDAIMGVGMDGSPPGKVNGVTVSQALANYEDYKAVSKLKCKEEENWYR
jgi:hypothetical protein